VGEDKSICGGLGHRRPLFPAALRETRIRAWLRAGFTSKKVADADSAVPERLWEMIILNPSHESVRAIIAQYKEQDGSKKISEIDVYVSEFDDVEFRIKTVWPTLTIYASMPGFAQYKSIGVQAHMQSIYGSGYRSGPVTVDVPESPTFDFSVSFDMAAEDLAAVLDKASNVKKNALAGVFRHVFGMAQRKELTPKALVIPYRSVEDCYLKVNGDGVIVIFQLQFKEANDLIIADVFMKEFKEARRDQALGQAPSVSFQKVAPLELEGLQVKQGVNIGFVSFGEHFFVVFCSGKTCCVTVRHTFLLLQLCSPCIIALKKSSEASLLFAHSATT
jgi:actin related protein 2/3 complex subunit 2